MFFRNAGGALALVVMLPWLREAAAVQVPPSAVEPVADGGDDGRILLTFTAFHLMPLADVMAIGFTQPIVVALASAVFLGERISRYGWAAVVLGLLGVAAGHPAVGLGAA